MKRRKFVEKAGRLAVLAGTIPLIAEPMNLMAGGFKGFSDSLIGASATRLTILHTNDVRAQIEALLHKSVGNSGTKVGGAAARASMIDRIRREEKNVLLLDAGGFFDGPSNANYAQAKLQFQAMNRMGYDASAIGSDDLQHGANGFADIAHHANFPFLNANYHLGNTSLAGKISSYKVFEKQALKIGVFGVGRTKQNADRKKSLAGVRISDPLKKAQETATYLRKKEDCDLVICLSRLGYTHKKNRIDDIQLAENTRHIDLIIGGYTRKCLDKPSYHKNLDHATVAVNQAGCYGLYLGRLDLQIRKTNGKRSLKWKGVNMPVVDARVS